MKKVLIAFVLFCLLLAGAYCGASYFAGGHARKQYEMLVAQKSAPYLELKIQKFERGIFSSTAEVSVEIKKPREEKTGEEVLRVELINSITHGPLVFLKSPHLSRSVFPALAVISTRLAPGAEKNPLPAGVLEKFPELESSEVLTVLNYDGSGESFFDVPSFQKKLPGSKGGETFVEWGGLKSTSRFDIGLNDISGSLNAPGLLVKDAQIDLAVKKVKMDINGHQGPKGVAVGDVGVSCEYVEVKPEGEKTFRLESAAIQTSSGTGADTVSVSFLASFDRLAAGEDTYGPFVMELEFRNLDAATIARFQEDMKEVQKQIAGKSDEEVKQVFEAAYTRLLKGLMAKSPEIELKQLKLATSRGELDAKLKIALAGSGASILENPLLALSSLSAEAEASVGEPLLVDLLAGNFKGDFLKEAENDPGRAEQLAAEKSADTIEALISQNLVVRDGGIIKASASYGAGKLVVNGRKINLIDLLRQ